MTLLKCNIRLPEQYINIYLSGGADIAKLKSFMKHNINDLWFNPSTNSRIVKVCENTNTETKISIDPKKRISHRNWC